MKVKFVIIHCVELTEIAVLWLTDTDEEYMILAKKKLVFE